MSDFKSNECYRNTNNYKAANIDYMKLSGKNMERPNVGFILAPPLSGSVPGTSLSIFLDLCLCILTLK